MELEFTPQEKIDMIKRSFLKTDIGPNSNSLIPTIKALALKKDSKTTSDHVPIEVAEAVLIGKQGWEDAADTIREN
jgi:hypothetical protein